MTAAAPTSVPSNLWGGVVLTSPYAWPHVRRGSETLIRSLGRWLRTAGVDVEIVAGGREPMRYDLDGVPVVLVRAHDWRRLHRDLDQELTLIPAMTRHLRRTRPALAHAFLYGDAAAARLAGTPYIVSFGGIALQSSFRRRPLKYRVFEYASRGARFVVCPSRAAAQHLDSEYGIAARVIPNGLDVETYRVDRPRRAGLILCTSTPNDQRKRVSVLFDAFAVAERRRPGLELVLAGRVDDAHRRALLDRLPPALQRRVRFVGEVDSDEVRRLYAEASVTCLPSLNEAFGMVLVESLASGTPVVGAAHGAIPEIVDDSVGSLFEPDNPEDCADALLTTLDRGTGDDVITRCRARAQTFDWSIVGPQLLNLYAEAS